MDAVGESSCSGFCYKTQHAVSIIWVEARRERHIVCHRLDTTSRDIQLGSTVTGEGWLVADGKHIRERQVELFFFKLAYHSQIKHTQNMDNKVSSSLVRRPSRLRFLFFFKMKKKTRNKRQQPNMIKPMRPAYNLLLNQSNQEPTSHVHHPCIMKRPANMGEEGRCQKQRLADSQWRCVELPESIVDYYFECWLEEG